MMESTNTMMERMPKVGKPSTIEINSRPLKNVNKDMLLKCGKIGKK